MTDDKTQYLYDSKIPKKSSLQIKSSCRLKKGQKPVIFTSTILVQDTSVFNSKEIPCKSSHTNDLVYDSLTNQ